MEELKGFCTIQERDYAIGIRKIPCTTFEDYEPKFVYGTINCEHANLNGCNRKKCSILEQYGINK